MTSLLSQFSQLSLLETPKDSGKRLGNIIFLLMVSEIKLLNKVVLLAAQLEQKRGKAINSQSKRHLLLLSALALVSRGCGLGSKLLQLDSIVDLISNLVCKVPLSMTLNALSRENGLLQLAADVRNAQLLAILHFLKLKHRKQRLNSPFNLLPYLQLLEKKRLFLHAQQAAMKQKLLALQQAKNAQLAQNITTLRTQQDDNLHRFAFLRHFLHAWRCLLNFRLVRARTRRRFKAATMARWRRQCRVGSIASIFYGKKVKLRAMNRWFHLRFGRSREQALTT